MLHRASTCWPNRPGPSATWTASTASSCPRNALPWQPVSDGGRPLETYIKQLLESHRIPEVTVAWQGGEPTQMGLEFFKLSVAYAEKYRRPDQRVQHTIQTNGTTLDDEWGAFFREHREQ